eukprot:5529778-Amphidinium_carterae.3
MVPASVSLPVLPEMSNPIDIHLQFATISPKLCFGTFAREIREVQVIFKAPHPMNMEAQHILVELRSAGYIEAGCLSLQDVREIPLRPDTTD